MNKKRAVMSAWFRERSTGKQVKNRNPQPRAHHSALVVHGITLVQFAYLGLAVYCAVVTTLSSGQKFDLRQ